MVGVKTKLIRFAHPLAENNVTSWSFEIFQPNKPRYKIFFPYTGKTISRAKAHKHRRCGIQNIMEEYFRFWWASFRAQSVISALKKGLT